MRWEGLKNRTYRAVTVMEPFISLGLEGRRAHHRIGPSIAAAKWSRPI